MALKDWLDVLQHCTVMVASLTAFLGVNAWRREAVDEKPGPEIKPSATSGLMIRHGDPECQDYLKITERDFEAETFEEVAAQVEAWAQEQMDRAVKALRAEFAAE